MSDFLGNSLYFGVLVSLFGYAIGVFLKKKLKLAIFNPLLIAIIFVMLTLTFTGVEYESYSAQAKLLGYLLTPATVCFAIPLYMQFELLKKYPIAIFGGVVTGVISSAVSVFGLCTLFGLTHEQYVTLLPKSITTAIGMGVSQELGGVVTITVAVIIVTGILGSIIAKGVLKLCRVKNKIAIGLALGASSHAVGTTKALEMGEVEGAMSSLAVALCGVITAFTASIFAGLM